MINNKKGNAKIWMYLLIAVVVFLLLFSIIGKKEELGTGDVTSGGGSSGGGSDSGDVPTWSWPTIDTSSWFDWADFSFDIFGDDTEATDDPNSPTPILPATDDEPFCIDSDLQDERGELDEIYVKGTCDDDLMDRTTYTDYCSRGGLIEYHCRNNQCATETVDCSAEYGTDWGCVDGRCVALL
jgi:hypothetical protein